MRQVPIYYLVIGTGRMARHFCHYLSLLKLPFTQQSARAPIETLQEALQRVTHVVILIRDPFIDSFIESLGNISDKALVHFSGCLQSKHAYSTHPLMTFTEKLYDKALYPTIPFILEQGSPPLFELLPGLANQAYFIPRELKAFYHALCVMSGNFTCLLWQKMFSEFPKTFQLPAAIAIPYLKQISQNLQENMGTALTGPLQRKDQDTIFANIQALQNDDFKEIYQAFVKVFAPELI